MNKFLIALSFCISTLLFSNYSEAAHCSGGHKEIKETKTLDMLRAGLQLFFKISIQIEPELLILG